MVDCLFRLGELAVQVIFHQTAPMRYGVPDVDEAHDEGGDDYCDVNAYNSVHGIYSMKIFLTIENRTTSASSRKDRLLPRSSEDT